ncbi:MAG: hypothetical protein ACU0CT_01225 [Paracoccaceae bacterium]
MADLAQDGWVTFPTEPALLEWIAAALPRARAAVADPDQRAKGLVCEGTWFVGVDALDNDPKGTVGGVPLRGAVRETADALFGPLPLHRAQVSVIWPGYPRPRDDESEAAFRYRQRRDGAHLDGMLPEGPMRRRFFREPHAWIMGLPLTECDAGASPLVIWRGSPHILRHALLRACDGHPPETWGDLDLTDAYTAARAEVFATCERVELSAAPGQAYLLHRLALHGVAPWMQGVQAPADGRMIAYFRPILPGGAAQSLMTE